MLQICDYPKIETFSDGELEHLRRAAAESSIRLELGTSGIDAAVLETYLGLASKLDVSFVRTTVGEIASVTARDAAVASLEKTLPGYAGRSVSIGLETYELVATNDLVHVIESVGSPFLGACLDPANCVARLERPTEVIEMVAPHVKSIHVKDFVFARQPRWVGFTLGGCPLGEGLLDYPALMATVRPRERGISQVVENWLPWQGTAEETCRLEQQWTEHNFEVLRKMQ